MDYIEEDIKEFRIVSKNLLLIFVEDLDEINKQKCQDYIKDQNIKDLRLSFMICDDDINCGNFYFNKEECDIFPIKEVIKLLKSLIIFLDTHSIKWEGYKPHFQLWKRFGDDLGGGFAIIQRNKFTLIFSNEDDIIIVKTFSFTNIEENIIFVKS